MVKWSGVPSGIHHDKGGKWWCWHGRGQVKSGTGEEESQGTTVFCGEVEKKALVKESEELPEEKNQKIKYIHTYPWKKRKANEASQKRLHGEKD